MKTFGELKIGDRFYRVRDTKVTMYEISNIVDHDSYLTVSGVDVSKYGLLRWVDETKRSLLLGAICDAEFLINTYY